jgi:hypothetical protein
MTENAKTITFVVVGLVAIAIGVFTRPSSAELDEQTLVGQDLTKNFDSPDEAKRLKIVRFDEETATLRDFEVAERDGLWTIPSKDGYPADAARQMAEAATSLMDRKIISVASMSAGDHEEFGVIDPQSPKLEVGQKGVGTHVTMYDVHDAPLADLIVGKAVKDAEGQRYVREAGRDIVYVIEIDPAKLSTNFEDWIEKDLLKLNSWDLQQVQVKDYSAELVPVMSQQGLRFQLAGDMRSDLTLAYNDSDSKWNAVTLRRFDPVTEKYVDFTLAEDEELNTETLNALKTALDDLAIVDVVRKPQGLSDDLKAGEDFMKNEEALRSLMEKGFTPTQSADGSGASDLVSSDGEVIATMKDGSEYVLRFGNLTNVGAGDNSSEQANDTPPATADAGADTDTKVSGVHRYLFVMARFNENAVKRPELEKLPELPAGEPASAGGNENQEATSTQAITSSESNPDETDAAAAATDTDADANEADDTDEEKPAADSSPDTASTPESTETPADEADATKSEPAGEVASATGDEAKTTESTPATEGDAKSSDSDKTKELETLVAERKRIEQENERKEKEYKDTLKKGQENVKDLNLRFGDWYFVVADDVFKKIRLSRENVIKKKEKKEDTNAAKSTEDNPALPSGTIPGLPPIPGAIE